MMRLNITTRILDKLGFSEYWAGSGDFGDRRLHFKSSDEVITIMEIDEKDDDTDGYASHGRYVAKHYLLSKSPEYRDLFFIEQLYDVVKELYPNSLNEFIEKLKDLKMFIYIEEYLKDEKK